MKDYLPDWAHPWLDVITLGLQIVLIVAAALLLRSLVVRITPAWCAATTCRSS